MTSEHPYRTTGAKPTREVFVTTGDAIPGYRAEHIIDIVVAAPPADTRPLSHAELEAFAAIEDIEARVAAAISQRTLQMYENARAALVAKARTLGADGIVGLHYQQTAPIAQTLGPLVCYGTAVTLVPVVGG